GPVRRGGHLRTERPAGRGTPPDRSRLPAAEPIPDDDLREHRLRPASSRRQGPREAGRAGRAMPSKRGHLGRGQGRLSQEVRAGTIRRPATAFMHRAHTGDGPRGDPHGRAMFCARQRATAPVLTRGDEPVSALDPVATLRIEQLMSELRENYTIVIVTHNMQQASRVSDETAFFSLGQDRAGFLVEMDRTTTIFTNPRERLTEDYVSGRFG